MRKLILSSLMAVACGSAMAQNPYLPLWEFIPDGEPYVFDDPDKPGEQRVYIYGSHDDLIKYYCGKDQVVWSASVNDLNHWRYDGVIFTNKTDAKGRKMGDGSGDVLYAPDVAVKTDANGKKTYYLYPNVQGSRHGLVAKSDRPDGPFKVCNWSTEKADSVVGPFAFDPAAFVDDDGRAYGYWGFGQSNCAELDTATMATVKPGTQITEHMIPGFEEDHLYRFFEASSIRKIKDKYVFIYSRMTNDGEFGLPKSNYTLAYCYSNSPLGPWTYGGTIIDGRGRARKADGTAYETACVNGNTHGSICEINGKWWVFYHRQAGTDEYSRQACVAPINVEVVEGKDGYVRIDEAEFTCEGFQTEGLDPYTRYQAGIACYFMSPERPHQEYPNMIYPGSHTQINRIAYDGKKDPYDPSINICQMVNNTAGSIVGYKYFNLSKTYGKVGTVLSINYQPEGCAGTIDVYLDQPSEAQGGVKIATINVPAEASSKAKDATVAVPMLTNYNGKHALFFTFNSDTKGKSLCQFNSLCFK